MLIFWKAVTDMREGPALLELPVLRCSGCRHLERIMWRSGQNPIYQHYCKHPNATAGDAFLLPKIKGADGELIGDSDVSPNWCPLWGETK